MARTDENQVGRFRQVLPLASPDYGATADARSSEDSGIPNVREDATGTGQRKRPVNGNILAILAPHRYPEGVAVNTRGRSYKILADVEITDANCSGVILAHGSRFGGYVLFIKDEKLHYAVQLPPAFKNPSSSSSQRS